MHWSSAPTGNVKWKVAPPMRVVGGTQPAAVRVDDGARDGQAHAQSLGLGGVERLEHALHVLRVDPSPGVLNLDPDGGRVRPGPSG